MIIRTILISFIALFSMHGTIHGQERYFDFDDHDEKEAITPRSISDESLDIYRNQDAFDYAENTNEESKLLKVWKSFWRKLTYNINKGFNLKIVMYLVAGTSIIAIIWFLLSTQSSTFISKKNEVNNRYVEELDIRVDESILRKKLEEAEATNAYKNAIRFAYLLHLKALNEKDKIVWKEYKLSVDYLSELNDEDLKSDFENMTNYFNYAWYGNRKITATNYSDVKNTYKNLITKIEKK